VAVFPDSIQSVIDRVDRLRTQVNDHWQIPRDEALLLAQLVSIGRYVSICEIGTSYGFSTLHLAAAARQNDGYVHTFEHDPKKVAAASQNLRDAGLEAAVTIHHGDAREILRAIQPRALFDFVFIDATKEESDNYLDAVWRKLAPRCALVTDNTTSHAAELASFVERLRALPGFTSCHVPVGNGFELTVRQGS
jgi:predicted O-methyltransferase YrrM